jgi:iron(III) transport system substrate-binding protein
MLKPEYKDGFAIANPALSGTSMVSVGMMVNNLGWEYFEQLKANGAKMGQGSGQVVDDTAAGDLLACIGVDYITIDKIKKGASLGIVFPPEMLVIPSPVAIFKGTPNLSAARKFVDFLLSKEGQEVIANSYTLPSRKDVHILKDIGLVEAQEAVGRAMKIDYLKLMAEKQATIEKFQKIMQGK